MSDTPHPTLQSLRQFIVEKWQNARDMETLAFKVVIDEIDRRLAESRPSADAPPPHEVVCQDCQGRGWNLGSDDKERVPCESCVGQPCEYEERVPKSADWTACRSAKTPGRRYCSLHEEIAKFNKKYPGYKVRRAEGAAVQPPAPTISSDASWEERYRAVRDVMPKWVLDHICEVLEVADDHLGKDRDFVKTFIASHERQCAEITRLREALAEIREMLPHLIGCYECGGSGYTVAPEHDSRCDGTCKVGCPVPVQVQCACQGIKVDIADIYLAAERGLTKETE